VPTTSATREFAVRVQALDLSVLVDEAGRLGALGDDPVHVARERFESVDVGSAGDLIGLGAGQVAVLLFVLRRELHDRLGEVDRPVGPLVGVDIGVRVEPEIGGVGARRRLDPTGTRFRKTTSSGTR